MDDDAHHRAGPADESQAWNVLAYLLAGPAFYGGLGWLLDRWLGTAPLLLVVGLLGGVVASWYLAIHRLGMTKLSNRQSATSVAPQMLEDHTHVGHERG